MRLRNAILLLTLCPSLAACGGGGQDPAKDVRKTLDAFAQATAQKDYQRLCDQIFAAKLVDQVRQTLPCEVALKNSSLDDAKDPRLEIRSVKVEGDTATADVRTSAANQPASEDTVKLVKERGSWRIVALAS